MSSLDAGCADKKVLNHVYDAKHAELGVFRAEKYYNMEMDCKARHWTDVGSSKPVCPVADVTTVRVIGQKSECKPRGFCPKSSDNVRFSYCMKSLCVKESKTSDGSGSIRRISTKACPETKPSQFPTDAAQAVTSYVKVLDKSKACEANKGHQIRNKATGSDYIDLGLVRKRADIEEGLKRRLAVLTWDAIPGAKTVQAAVRKVDGYESDTSSELFEIESLSISTRQSVSTATRHGSIRSDAPSPTSNPDYNDKKICLKPPRIGVQRRNPGFLSCSSQKSIAVYEPTYLKSKQQMVQCTPNPKQNSSISSSVRSL